MQVPDSAMTGIRASSEPYAMLNSRTVRESLGTYWALSETGASGPTATAYGIPPDMLASQSPDPVERSITLETGDDDREANMWVFAKAALELLEQCVREAHSQG